MNVLLICWGDINPLPFNFNKLFAVLAVADKYDVIPDEKYLFVMPSFISSVVKITSPYYPLTLKT